MAGPLKNYNVGGKDLGDGRPAPADTVLRLDRATAEKMGLEKPSRKAEVESKPADVVTKPRTASTRKRTTRRR